MRKPLSFIKKAVDPLIPPFLGGVGGIIYGLVDNFTDPLFSVSTRRIIIFAHDIVDFVLPVVVGIIIGLAVNLVRRQTRMNQELSTQNTKLQRDLLVNTLTSLFLHEIRNPIHNIAAALDDNRVTLPEEVDEMVTRNLKSLEQITAQYRQSGSLFDRIDPKEKTELRPWLKDFVENKVRSKLRELHIDYTQEIDPVKVGMHPVLLDQSFTTVFSNACEALAKEPGKRQLRLISRLQAPHYKKVEIKLINQGQGFKEEVLERQGRSPVESKTGLGVGLTLLRKILEQVEGEIILSNFIGHADVTLVIPGESE